MNAEDDDEYDEDRDHHHEQHSHHHHHHHHSATNNRTSPPSPSPSPSTSATSEPRSETEHKRRKEDSNHETESQQQQQQQKDSSDQPVPPSDLISHETDCFYEITQKLFRDYHENLEEVHKHQHQYHPSPAESMEKVKSTLRQYARDWSSDVSKAKQHIKANNRAIDYDSTSYIGQARARAELRTRTERAGTTLS